MQMLSAMRDMAIETVQRSANGWLAHDAVLYDFVILGLFTGSRVHPGGTPFRITPTCQASGAASPSPS
jgi:hypothetical protein